MPVKLQVYVYNLIKPNFILCQDTSISLFHFHFIFISISSISLFQTQGIYPILWHSHYFQTLNLEGFQLMTEIHSTVSLLDLVDNADSQHCMSSHMMDMKQIPLASDSKVLSCTSKAQPCLSMSRETTCRFLPHTWLLKFFYFALQILVFQHP